MRMDASGISVPDIPPLWVLFLAVKQNGERLAHTREEDDVRDEAPRHLQEG